MRLVPLLACSLACAPDPSIPSVLDDPATSVQPACVDGPMELEVGGGAQEHQALSELDRVVMVHGPQNGWHVWGSGEVHSAGQEVAVSARLTVAETGELLAEPPTWFLALAGYSDADCAGSFFGLQIVLTDIAGPLQAAVCDLAGREVLLEISVEDLATGEVASDAVVVLAEPDPTDGC